MHFVGVVACLAGLGIIVYSDYRVLHAHDHDSDEGGGQKGWASSLTSFAVLSSSTTSAAAAAPFPRALEGDLLTLLGAALYACSNVLQACSHVAGGERGKKGNYGEERGR